MRAAYWPAEQRHRCNASDNRTKTQNENGPKQRERSSSFPEGAAPCAAHAVPPAHIRATLLEVVLGGGGFLGRQCSGQFGGRQEPGWSLVGGNQG